MSDKPESPMHGEDSSPPPADSAPVLRPIKQVADTVYFGPNGLRAGWRLLFFFIVLNIFQLVLFPLLRLMKPGFLSVTNPAALTPRNIFTGEMALFGLYLAASLVMALVEGRRISDFGLPWRGAFRVRFWLGALGGFCALAVLMFALRLAGVFHLGPLALHGAQAWKYAGVWAVVFFALGLREDFNTRGYILFTLTTGIGFWPAAIATSVWFSLLHIANPGESIAGVICTGAIGFFFCILVLRTGDLWAPIGFHMAWDWGQTYFFGVPDSGLVESGHLFNGTLSGAAWLTGGSAGPEASWLCLAMIALLCAAAGLFVRRVKYPDPAAVPDPRARR